jgi:hypothetical protein
MRQLVALDAERIVASFSALYLILFDFVAIGFKNTQYWE